MTQPDQDACGIPGQENYTPQYLRGGRVFSYAHQIDSVLTFEPRSVIEVGIGPGMVSAALRTLGVSVTTVDVQAELNPDIVASVTDLPLKNGAADVALCCQVLEHLPFEGLEKGLKELARVATMGVVISLPDITPYYEVRLRLPRLREIHWTGTRRRCPPKAYCEQVWQRDGHYWEIGYPETPLRRIEQSIAESGLDLVRTWRVPDMHYHRFFALRPRRKGKESHISNSVGGGFPS